MDEFVSRQYPVQEHMAFQRRLWILQRVGWVLLAVIILAALLGLFGSGILSKRTISSGALTVDYERFERTARLTQFVFHFPPAQNADRRLRLSRSFQTGFEITSVQPPPVRSASTPDGFELTFAASVAAADEITIWAHPRRYGTVHVGVGADDSPPLDLHIFIYP